MSATTGLAALVPHIADIPGPPERLGVLLFLTFVPHLLLMNAVVGGVLITLVNLFRKPGEAEAGRAFASVLPKGMALVVNLGVPPLLFIQALLGAFFYSASILSALYWLAVPFVVMLAYYGLYIYTSSAEIRAGLRKTVLVLTAALLLGNIFIFVNKATLTQAPEAWAAYAHSAGGTILNLADPQLWPRYLHVLLSCLAVGGLSFALPAWLKLRNLARADTPLPRQQIWFDRMQNGYRWFIGATLAQVPVGLWFLLSLPRPQMLLFMGKSPLGTALFAAGLLFAGAAVFAALRRRIGWSIGPTVGAVFCMAGMRTLLRLSLLEPYGLGGEFRTDAGPFWVFLLAAALTGAAVYRLCRLYKKSATREAE